VVVLEGWGPLVLGGWDPTAVGRHRACEAVSHTVPAPLGQLAAVYLGVPCRRGRPASRGSPSAVTAASFRPRSIPTAPRRGDTAGSVCPRRLLIMVGLPSLIDEIGANCIDIRFAQQITEFLHSRLREQALEDDLIEERVVSEWRDP